MPTNNHPARDRRTHGHSPQTHMPRTLADIMAPSSPNLPRTKETGFLGSRKNLRGIVAAGGVIGLHFIVGIGFLWPVVAAAAYGGVALLTPPKKQADPLPLTEQEQAYELEEVMYAQLRIINEMTSRAVQIKFWDMYEEIHWVLEHWQRFADSGAAKSSISNIIQQHIPDVMDAYLQVVGHDRDEHVEDIVGILDIFQQEAAGIRQAAEANSVSMLRERTLAVELQYGVMPVLKDTDG